MYKKKLEMPLLNMLGGGTDSLRTILEKHSDLKLTDNSKNSSLLKMPVLTGNVPLTNDSKLILNKDDYKCAPGFNFSNGSCMTIIMVIALSKAYNKYYKENTIPII